MKGRPFLSRLERFASVDSTQRIVREWLDAGTREVCVAVADEQTAGRGRQGRGWLAPCGAALLVSAGFRPAGLPVRHAWRLAATASLAMVDAVEMVAGLPEGALFLKWPNDLVADGPDGRLLKVAGVLGETVAMGGAVGHAIIGLGVNADWPASDFPPALAAGMTSLHELAGGRHVDRDALLDTWLGLLEARIEALRDGKFDAAGWESRQVTTGRQVMMDLADEVLVGMASGVDPESGSLLVTEDETTRPIDSGEVLRCRVV